MLLQVLYFFHTFMDLTNNQGLSRDIWGIPDNREMETISQPSFLLPTASELLIPTSFLPCSSHLTLQRIGRSRIIFIKIQTPVFYKYLLEIAFFYCEVQLIQQIRNQLNIIKVVIFDIFTLDFSLWKLINNIKKE